MQLNTLQHRIRRRGLEWAVVVVGIVLAIGTGEPGNAVMLAALAYIVGSAFQELWRHRWFGVNAALLAVGIILASGPMAVLYSGDLSYFLAAPTLSLVALTLGYVVWLVVGLPATHRRQVGGRSGALVATASGAAARAWMFGDIDEGNDCEHPLASMWNDHKDDDNHRDEWMRTSSAHSYHPNNVWYGLD